MISGHKDFNTLYASNDTVTQSFIVNTLGAPNDSTTMVSSLLILLSFKVFSSVAVKTSTVPSATLWRALRTGILIFRIQMILCTSLCLQLSKIIKNVQWNVRLECYYNDLSQIVYGIFVSISINYIILTFFWPCLR